MNTKARMLTVSIIAALCFPEFAAAGETIGPFEIGAAPVSASMITGEPGVPFPAFNAWLNVENVAISVNEALTGMSILDDAVANLSSDALFELNYAPNIVRNVEGADLVLFDARWDDGSYAVSSSFDGFVRELEIAGTSFINTGETRDYYMEHYGGPYLAEIYGAAFDLSALGVPSDATVDAIRVRSIHSEDGASDLVGVGVQGDGVSPCDLEVALSDYPTSVELGGTLSFTASATNGCDDLLTFDRAEMNITGPASLDKTLYAGDPFTVVERVATDLSLDVPSGAPLGTYSVQVSIYRDGEIIDADAFDVEVSG